jgi:excisionase family DNA binding protein
MAMTTKAISEGVSTDYLSTREAAARLGVSLSMVQRMVEAGDLQAWKTSGGHRRIPTAAIEAHLSARAMPTGARRAGREFGVGQRNDSEYAILVVEDDPALLKLYAARIAAWKLPVRLEIAEDGYEAILKAARQLPDLMIVDLLLPKLGGAEVIRKLRADSAFNLMNIIVVTGVDAAELEKKFNLPPDVTVLGKPVPFAQLLGFVQAGIAARRRTA